MEMCACDPITNGAEAGESRVLGHPGYIGSSRLAWAFKEKAIIRGEPETKTYWKSKAGKYKLLSTKNWNNSAGSECRCGSNPGLCR